MRTAPAPLFCSPAPLFPEGSALCGSPPENFGEFLEFVSASDDVDVVILAGDIDVKGCGVSFAKRFPCPVVYVADDHEYYGRAILRLTEKLKEAAVASNAHLLDCDAVIIGGTRFLGASLWTDWRGNGSVEPTFAMEHARAGMFDYKKICVSPKFSRRRPTRSNGTRSLEPGSLVNSSNRTRGRRWS